MSNLTLYYQRKAQGLCVQCGKVPPVKDRIKCEKCAEASRACSKRFNDRRRQAAIEERLRKYPPTAFECQWCHKLVITDSSERADKRKRFCCSRCCKKWWRKRYKQPEKETSVQSLSVQTLSVQNITSEREA